MRMRLGVSISIGHRLMNASVLSGRGHWDKRILKLLRRRARASVRGLRSR